MKKLALLLVSVMLSISIVACSDDDGAEVIFYIVRHAETYSNADHGLYGWYDSPLTLRGRNRTIEQRACRDRNNGGLGGIEFSAVYSSTSGRAISTARILDGLTPLEGALTDVSPSSNARQGISDRIITDPRLREINFGRFEGLIMTVLPSVHPLYEHGSHIGAQSSLYFALVDQDLAGPYDIMGNFTIFQFANGIHTLDIRAGSIDVPYLNFNVLPPHQPIETGAINTRSPTALVAETGAVLRNRIEQGIRAIAQTEAANGGGNVLVVAHGITIMALSYIFDSSVDPQLVDVGRIRNNSVLRVRYQNGDFTILGRYYWGRSPLDS